MLVDYIIDEASGYPSNQYNTIVDVRMLLLLRACSQKKHLLRTVTKHLYERLKLNRYMSSWTKPIQSDESERLFSFILILEHRNCLQNYEKSDTSQCVFVICYIGMTGKW